MMPEPREGATFGTKFFSDICSARQASIETSWHSLKFQKSFLVNRSTTQPECQRLEGQSRGPKSLQGEAYALAEA